MAFSRIYEAYTTGVFPPELNDGGHIFVFGSNEAGRHGAGAAKTAFDHWGAIYGQGEGRQGCSYGIPTKDGDLNTLPISTITEAVERFGIYALENPDLTFLVTKIGCGLAGYPEQQIKPLFKGVPENCILPPNWK